MKNLMVALSLALLPFFALAKAEVVFEREIEVSDRSTLTWADLAVVKNASPDLRTELSSVIYSGGGAKEIRSVYRDRKAQTAAYDGVKVLIPQNIVVRKVKGYSSAEFRRKLFERLNADCSECSFDIRSIRDEQIRLGSDWRMDGVALRPSNQLLVSVATSSATAWIPVSLRVSKPALVLKKSIPMGQRITADDVEVRDAEIGSLREAPATLADLKEAVTARSVVAGKVLAAGDIKAEEAVKRGQPVKLISGSDEFEITVDAIAESGGRPGDMVKVKNVRSGTVMTAVVTGRGQVRLQ